MRWPRNMRSRCSAHGKGSTRSLAFLDRAGAGRRWVSRVDSAERVAVALAGSGAGVAAGAVGGGMPPPGGVAWAGLSASLVGSLGVSLAGVAAGALLGAGAGVGSGAGGF